jgi:hypothetical protein
MNVHIAMRHRELEDELEDTATPGELAELGLIDDQDAEGEESADGEHRASS